MSGAVRGEVDDEALATEVARRYYLDDQSKVTIADELGLSRFQVARVLAAAREAGLVRIEVGRRGAVDDQLGHEVAARLGIGRAVVLTGLDGVTDDELTDHLGRALADVLMSEVPAGCVLGLTYSRALVAMSRHVRRLVQCDVVQLAGHLMRADEQVGSPELVRTVAARSGGHAYPVYAPMLADNRAAARAFARQPEIADALTRARAVDVAAVSIGAWAEGLSGVYEWATPRVRERGTRLGACGEVSGRVYDGDGRPVPGLLDERVLAVSLADLVACPHVVASCYGAGRAQALTVAARAGLVDTLVTDRALARALVAT